MKKIYLSFFIPFALYSQSLEQLVQDAMENQLIDSSRKNIESIKKEYESVKSGYLPKLTLGSIYSNTNEETASLAENSLTTYANLNYTIYDGGAKGAKYKAYETAIKSSNESLQALKNNIALEVINYYFQYQSLIASKESKNKEIETLTAQQQRLEKFLDVGSATSDEVDKIISRVQSANVVLHEIELNIQTVLHNLQYLTAKEVTIDRGSLIKETSDIHEELKADLKALEYDMETTLSNARISKSTDYPTISLDNTYNYYDMDYENKAYENNLDTQNILKLNLTWKLYDFGKTEYAYESVYKQYQSLKSKYEYEKNKADTDLQLSKKSYEIAKLKISSAKAALQAANSTYDMIESKYQNGLVENVAYLEALSEKYEAQSALTAAQNDLEIKKAQIIYHSGKNLQEYIK